MGWVYFVRDCSTGLVKIGRTSTNEVDGRRTTLRTANRSLKLVRRIETPDALELESFLHNFFAGKRKSGEFFALDDQDLDEAERVAILASDSVFSIQDRVAQLKSERDNGVPIVASDVHLALVNRLRAA